MRNFTLLKINLTQLMILVFSVFFIVIIKLDRNKQVSKITTSQLETKPNSDFLNHLKVQNSWCMIFVDSPKSQNFKIFNKNENFKIQENYCILKKDTNLKFINYV